MTRLDALERAVRAIARRVLGEDHSIAELAALDGPVDEPTPSVVTVQEVPAEFKLVMEQIVATVNDMQARTAKLERFQERLIGEAVNKLKEAS